MMKKVTIQKYQTGLVFEKGKLVKVLKEGTHWLFGNKQVRKFQMTGAFECIDLSIHLKNDTLRELLYVIDVKDAHLAVVFEDGRFKNVLGAGAFAFWKGVYEYTFTIADTRKVEITEEIPEYILESAEMRGLTRKFNVLNHEKGMLFVDGKYVKSLSAGTYYFWNNSVSVEVKTVDLRQQQLEISGQELLSKDKAGLRVNFFVRYQVIDVEKALVKNKDFEKQLYIIMQLALRAFIGGFSLDEILNKKEIINDLILEEVGDKIVELGLKVSDAGIRDIILPGEMKEIMNQVLVAEKKAQANTIVRRDETASTRSLLNSAKLMEENEMLWKLKEMEYVEKIAERIGDISISGSGNVISQLKEIFVK